MPLYLNPKSGRFTTTKLSLGALGDSYYEYLLKMWILKGRSPADEMYRSMWERAMDEMIEKLVFTSIPEGLTYVAEFDRCACLCMSGGGVRLREGGGGSSRWDQAWLVASPFLSTDFGVIIHTCFGSLYCWQWMPTFSMNHSRHHRDS